MSSRVVPLKPNSLPLLRVASTAQRGEPLPGSRNEVWLCPAFDSAARGVMLYVKPALPVRRIMIEALAAQVGQCMQLPCPDPYIVTLNPQHVGRPRGPKLFAFGSQQVGDRSLNFPVLDLDVLISMLDRQKLCDPLITFDELIANPVRHARDVVFNPEHGALVIDHEGAMEPSTRADTAVTNWLADRVLERMDEKQRPVLLKRLRSKIAVAQAMSLGAAPSAVQLDQRGVPLYNELVNFLSQRLAHLDQLLSERVHPRQFYIHKSTDHAAGRATDL